MNDSESDISTRKKCIKIKAYIWRFSRSGRYQTSLSVVVALTWIAFYAHYKKFSNLTLGTFGAYFGFLVGIAAILILVSSMTMGLLVYFFQMMKSDQNTFYRQFRDDIAGLREVLDRLYDDGVISAAYDETYREVEMLMKPKELPLLFWNTTAPFMELVKDELLERAEPDEKAERAYRKIITRLAIIEETVNNLGVNLIARVVTKTWVSPVIKSFWTLGAVVIAVLIAVIHFRGLTVVVLDGFAMGIGCMTILLLIEAGRIAVQESQEYFSDESDVDHTNETPTNTAER
jgi:hypothetical protein